MQMKKLKILTECTTGISVTYIQLFNSEELKFLEKIKLKSKDERFVTQKICERLIAAF